MKMSQARQKTSYRFILVGKTGSGKSATGNFLLNKNFSCSKESVSSVTQVISLCESTALNKYNITVIDTPGFVDTKKPVIETALTIQDSLKFVAPGPHAFLIVLKPGRFTEEEEMTLEILKITFGPKFIDHAIIICTHLDQMEDVDTFLNESKENARLKSLFDSCGQRIFTLNIKETNTDIIERKREKLMQMVSYISENGSRFYADDISIYRACLEKHAFEWTDTRWDFGKIQTILREQKEEAVKLERERQEQLQTREKDKKEEAERLVQDQANEVAKVKEATDASTEFEGSLKNLFLHLQISLQRKLDAKRKECMLKWKEISFPETIINAVREINKAKTDRNWEDCVRMTKATVEMIETFQPNELPEKQELLMYIYSYFSPTSVENGDFTKRIGNHDKERIFAIEKLLKTLPEEKYPYEAALLYFEITMRYLTLQKSFENRESFKNRALSAARKAKDPELQLFGTVLFVLAEWMASTTDIGPANQREHLFRLTFSMERSLQLAQRLDDRVATEAIQTIVQHAEIRLKRPYPKEIDNWMRTKLSKKIKYSWIKTQETKFNHENALSEETEGLASHLDGSTLPSLKIKYAIRHGDVEHVKQYLKNQTWEHEDELFDSLNYSLAFRDSDGKQTMSKHVISWICEELTKSHEPNKVLVWAASIAKEYSTETYLVLVCNYCGYVDQKFKDKCFFGIPVIYQDYNTVSDEEQYVQCSETFLETSLSPNEAMHANQIISENTDWLMNTYSNLEVIKPCHVRSALPEVRKETCIVLYCRMKGFIPFGECQFPPTLSAGGISFPTDVREGFYVPAMLQEGAQGKNDSQLFRMGYSMGPDGKNISATVGPFVKMEGNNVGFLTCAHAFGVPSNIQEALKTPVVHPAKGEYVAVNQIPADETICGYVDTIVFDINPNTDVNVDVALIQLKSEKIPNKGRFYTIDGNFSRNLSFDHGEIMTKENIEEVLLNPDGKIIKIGAASGVTSSNLFYNGRAAIRIREAELLHEHGHIFPPIIEGTRSYVMKGQYLIQSRPDMVFLIAGDSGSGVFYIDKSQRLRCIGIAIGFLADNTFAAVVTPIEDVLRALGLDENSLMRFPVQEIYKREPRQETLH